MYALSFDMNNAELENTVALLTKAPTMRLNACSSKKASTGFRAALI